MVPAVMFRAAFGILLVTTAGQAHAATNALRDTLQRLDRQTQTIQDLTADFREEKFTTLLRKPLVSKGHIFVKGKQTRWHTTVPRESTLFTNETRVAIYFPSRATMEVYPVDRRLRALIASPVPRIATLQQHFHIELNPEPTPHNLNLRLTPKDDSLKDFVVEIRLSVDLTLGLATRIEMLDPEENRTVIIFKHVRTNVGLSEDDVAYHVPAGTKVIHPLDPSPKLNGISPSNSP